MRYGLSRHGDALAAPTVYGTVLFPRTVQSKLGHAPAVQRLPSRCGLTESNPAPAFGLMPPEGASCCPSGAPVSEPAGRASAPPTFQIGVRRSVPHVRAGQQDAPASRSDAFSPLPTKPLAAMNIDEVPGGFIDFMTMTFKSPPGMKE